MIAGSRWRDKMSNEFRSKLADRMVGKPDFMKGYSREVEFTPHPELVRLAEFIRNGGSLKEAAIRAWTYQDNNDLPVHVAANLRTTYRRIHRHLNQLAVA